MPARLIMTQAEIDADRGRWLEERRSRITASEIASVMGIAPKNQGSPFALFTAKRTRQDWVPDNDEMRRGRYLEPYVAEQFAADHPDLEVLDGGLYASYDRPWQAATFDRIAVDLPAARALGDDVDGVRFPVQIKTWSTRHDWDWGDAGTADMPVHVKAQAVYEMDVYDATLALVPVLFMPTWEVVTYIIERDDDVQADIAFMRAEAESFLSRLERDDPPDIDWTPATTGALKFLHPDLEDRAVRIPKQLARRYQAARKAKDRAERRLGLAQNQIRARLGSASRAIAEVDGEWQTVVSRSKYPQRTIAVKELRKAHPDIAAEFTKSTDVDKLNPRDWEG